MRPIKLVYQASFYAWKRVDKVLFLADRPNLTCILQIRPELPNSPNLIFREFDMQSWCAGIDKVVSYKTVAMEDVNALSRPGWLKMRVRRDEVNYRVV